MLRLPQHARLFTLSLVVCEAQAAEPRPQPLHPARPVLILCLVLEPGYWMFPLVRTIQVMLVIRGNCGSCFGLPWRLCSTFIVVCLDGIESDLARYALDFRGGPILRKVNLVSAAKYKISQNAKCDGGATEHSNAEPNKSLVPRRIRLEVGPFETGCPGFPRPFTRDNFELGRQKRRINDGRS
jgi:hypothetical protein